MRQVSLFFICFLFVKNELIAQQEYCPGSNFTIVSSIAGSNYKWEIDSGFGFVEIAPTTQFTGESTNSLQVLNAASIWYNYQFRCKVDFQYSEIFVLKFTNRWIGIVDNNFFNAANWSCGTIPGIHTDVIIDGGTVQLNTSTSVRSLTLLNNGSFNVAPGIVLSFTGKDTMLNDFNLTIEDIEVLDTLTVPTPLQTLRVLDDPIKTLKNEKIEELLEKARIMCAMKIDSTFSSDTAVGEPPLVYKGLAYSYGSRNHQITQTPPSQDADMLHRRYPVRGTDCSGMMIILLRSINILISPGNTSSVTFEKNLRDILNGSSNPYPTLRLLTLDSLREQNVTDGDFICWPVKKHIGMLYDKGGQEIVMYQSNGNPDPLTKQRNNRTPHQEQFANWGSTRGACVKDWNELTAIWGRKYRIYRLAEVYNMANTPAFTTNNFTSVGVGKGGYIYAGTSNAGLYKFNGNNWQKLNVLTNNLIHHIQKDKNGGIWIAQSGHTGAQATTGGLNYLPDSTMTGFTFYTTTMGLPTRYCRSVFIDTMMLLQGTPRVWTAHLSHITGGVSTTGAVGLGLYPTLPNFIRITTGIETTNGLGSVQTIGGNNSEIWAFASVNFGRNQIRRYNAQTGDTIQPVGAYDYVNTPGLTSNFSARAIYFDVTDKRWIGFSSGGVLVKNGDTWTTVNFPTIFPSGTFVNNNAIAGTKSGHVFIGTTNGLVIYDGAYPLNDVRAYKRLTMTEGLPSNNVKGIFYDEGTKRLILATDSGIVVVKYL